MTTAVPRGSAATARRIGQSDSEYPPRALDLEKPPAQLWALGDAALLQADHVVAIVGTRQSTDYGERVTRDIAAAFVRAGAVVVSGMARGIDAAAHRGALGAGGRTIAVLGTGVDVPYPASHHALHAQIASTGLVISEMPLGSRPHRGSFVQRNRIIAGISQATIVVEAGLTSGALDTAERAEAINRPVGAVPGRIDMPMSAGVNQRIKVGGAELIGSIDDALALLGLSHAAPTRLTFASEVERLVWNALARPAPTMDVLATAARLPARECMQAVTALELSGAVECALSGEIRRRS